MPQRARLRYPNVIVAHWPKPGSGKHVRAWHCLTCKATIYDDRPGGLPGPSGAALGVSAGSAPYHVTQPRKTTELRTQDAFC